MTDSHEARMTEGRYHLTLTADGRPAMHGWWASEDTARRKWTAWIGGRGSLPGGRVTLVDEDTGETLTEWPGVVGGGG